MRTKVASVALLRASVPHSVSAIGPPTTYTAYVRAMTGYLEAPLALEAVSRQYLSVLVSKILVLLAVDGLVSGNALASINAKVKVKVKVSVFIQHSFLYYTQGAQAWITQFYLQLHQCLPLSVHQMALPQTEVAHI